jgi:Mce-associated membrane protein
VAETAEATDTVAAGPESETADEGEEPAFGWTPPEDNDEAPRPAGVWAVSVAALVVLLIAGLVTAGLYWNKASKASATTNGAQGAVSTAKTAVTDLFTINYKDPSAFAARLKPLAAGQFLGVVNNSANGVTKLLQQGQVQTTGKVAQAGVEKMSSNGDTAQVAVLGYEIIKNSQNPQGSERPYRMVLSMVKSGPKWVVSNLEFVQ